MDEIELPGGEYLFNLTWKEFLILVRAPYHNWEKSMKGRSFLPASDRGRSVSHEDNIVARSGKDSA